MPLKSSVFFVFVARNMYMTASVNDVTPVSRFLSFAAITRFDFRFVFNFQLWKMVLCFCHLMRTPVKCLCSVDAFDFIAFHEKAHTSITRTYSTCHVT